MEQPAITNATVYVSPEATAQFIALLEEQGALRDRQTQERADLERKHSDEIADWHARWGVLTEAHRGETLVFPEPMET